MPIDDDRALRNKKGSAHAHFSRKVDTCPSLGLDVNPVVPADYQWTLESYVIQAPTGPLEWTSSLIAWFVLM